MTLVLPFLFSSFEDSQLQLTIPLTSQIPSLFASKLQLHQELKMFETVQLKV
jgi:hypothetical protein